MADARTELLTKESIPFPPDTQCAFLPRAQRSFASGRSPFAMRFATGTNTGTRKNFDRCFVRLCQFGCKQKHLFWLSSVAVLILRRSSRWPITLCAVGQFVLRRLQALAICGRARSMSHLSG